MTRMDLLDSISPSKDVMDKAIDKVENTSDLPVIEVTFKGVDSAAFDVKYAGISPAMFAAFASWANYMSTKGYAERDYMEAARVAATQKIITAPASALASLPGGKN
jgi:hypothetical protein